MVGTLIVIGIGATVATALGGLFALRFKDRLHLIVGFSAGAVLGVAFFDLLPEAMALNILRGPEGTFGVIALGFLLYLVIDRMFSIHANHGHDHDNDGGHEYLNAHRAIVGPLSLAIHSFLDGLAIGFAFQVSSAVGIVITLAVLTHDFSDGINTVNLTIFNGGSDKRARWWLVLDSIAPVLGIIVGTIFSVSESTLGILIALFAGFFLYIGASELVPESHHRHPRFWTTGMTLVGMGTLYLVIQLAGM